MGRYQNAFSCPTRDGKPTLIGKSGINLIRDLISAMSAPSGSEAWDAISLVVVVEWRSNETRRTRTWMRKKGQRTKAYISLIVFL
jgi:hypothetical protein